MNFKYKVLGIIIAFTVSGCATMYDFVTFTVDSARIVANGTIDRSTIAAFKKITNKNPNIKTLVLQNIGGSVDDEANLELSRMVRAAEFTTVVPSNGLIASGGTDLFLAGKKRVLEQGACVGVHSWGGNSVDGGDLPRTSPEHKPYLDYYRDVTIPEEFYWFTLTSASANDMHWMTRVEADKYTVATAPSPSFGASGQCDIR